VTESDLPSRPAPQLRAEPGLTEPERAALDDLVSAANSQSAQDLEQEVATLRTALATRLLIGQASGMLAAVLSMSTDDAWQVLRITSNATNIKVRDVARILIDGHNETLAEADAVAAVRIADGLVAAAEDVRRFSRADPR
jgi:hypothetical protein